MNIVLQIKKKWKKQPTAAQAAAGATPTSAQPPPAIDPPPTNISAETEAAASATTDDPNTRLNATEIENLEEEDQELCWLNAPARGKAAMPSKIPDNIPHTRQGLFDLWQFMEYSKSKEIYKQAWSRLQIEFSDQGEILVYLKTYYIDEKGEIVAKWAGHQICWNDNQGLRTTSSTEASHRKVKGFLKYGFGNIVRLVDCVDQALATISAAIQEAEGRQINTQLTAYASQKWMGDLPRRCAFGGLKMLKQAYDWALDTHEGRRPRTNCACSLWKQYQLRCHHWILDKIIENGGVMKREDIGAYWWLERDLAEHDPVLLVGPMAKARKLPGRPRGTGTFNANERSVFGQQVMENKTVHNTTSMGKKNKTGAGSASVTRVLSAHEYKSSTLDSLDEEDELANQKAAQKNEALQNALLQSKKRGRPPGSKKQAKGSS